MSEFYEQMRQVANEILGSELGQSGISYIHVTSGTGDDEPTAPTETTYALKAVARGVSYKYVNGSTVLTSDLQVTFAAQLTFTPDAKGFVVINGKRYKIVEVHASNEGDVTIAWTLIVRK